MSIPTKAVYAPDVVLRRCNAVQIKEVVMFADKALRAYAMYNGRMEALVSMVGLNCRRMIEDNDYEKMYNKLVEQVMTENINLSQMLKNISKEVADADKQEAR
jgi:hypothetical protein